MENKLLLSELTFFGFNINFALDDGKGQDISFEDIYSGLESGRLLRNLVEKYPDTFNLIHFDPEGDKEGELLRVLNNVAGGVEGRERKKTGVEHSGLNLLMAFVLEAIQQGLWVEKP